MPYTYVNDTVALPERLTVAAGIAEALGYAIHPPNEGSHYFSLFDPDDSDRGIGLSFVRDSVKGDQIDISGRWPKTKVSTDGMKTPSDIYPRESSPSIRVTASRGVAVIVKDIQRRLLPEYDRIYKLCRVRADEADKYASTTIGLATQLAQEFDARRSQNDRDGGSLFLGESSHGYQIRVQGDSVRFEAFSVPAGAARRVLDALRKQEGDE